ncbi:Movement protein TGB2 [Dissostichus eleginoides]|uniref:Movement protein TGB2 n=1 Tax=Dissostichus eleginoides TaxID=100907 RepID=A0AAD9C8U4_DISEL|nr:Movement protein TGB2 [Dissostichus eleginoides]
MEADGGRALHRYKRTRYLAVIVVQNVLVTACLVVTLYLFWGVQNQEASEDNVHIQFNPKTVRSGNRTVQFGKVKSSNMMSLADGKNDKIHIECTGPYVLYMEVCYKSMDGTETGGVMELQVLGRDTPRVSSFSLHASHEVSVCKGLHSTAYLSNKEEASLHLYPMEGFRFESMTVGLSYLLGSRCEY